MIIDVVVAAILLMAIVKGYQRGLIIALFSVLAFIAGIAAALKLSSTVAVWLGQSTNLGARWLPFVSFCVVFLGVVVLVRLGASFIEKAVKLVLLGWLNKMLGILLYLFLYAVILSVFLFYAQKLHVFSDTTINESVTFNHIAPWGPGIINGLGVLLPLFKNMFEELGTFFSNMQSSAQMPY